MEKDNKIIDMPGKKEEGGNTGEEIKSVNDIQDVCIGLSNTIGIPMQSRVMPGKVEISAQVILTPCIKGQCHHWDKTELRCKLEKS